MPPSSNAMSRNQKKTVRKPATKFSHLREKMGKAKAGAKQRKRH